MSPEKRILIADDHGFIREALCRLVESRENWRVVGAASNGEEAIRLLHTQDPDLLLVDLSMPGLGGMRVIEAAVSLKPGVRILVVTAHNSSSFIRSALQAGAHGYLVKTGDGREVVRAVQTILDGCSYLSPEITEDVIKGFVRAPSKGKNDLLSDLTPRELEIVNKILEGTTRNKDLADQLNISLKTIQKHKTNIFSKLNADNTQELLNLLNENGINNKDEERKNRA